MSISLQKGNKKSNFRSDGYLITANTNVFYFILVGFWDVFGKENQSKREDFGCVDDLDPSLEVGSSSGINLAASWDSFWKALEASQGGFWNDFGIFLGYSLGNAIL